MSIKPEYLDQLMDAASEKAGSDYALAKMLDTSRSSVSDWRHGRKTCPIADQALMASIAGLNAEEWTARALVQSYAGTPKGVKLERALKKLLVVTGAAIVSSGASATMIFSTSSAYLIRCILC